MASQDRCPETTLAYLVAELQRIDGALKEAELAAMLASQSATFTGEEAMSQRPRPVRSAEPNLWDQMVIQGE